jgi:hypothetical protein
MRRAPGLLAVLAALAALAAVAAPGLVAAPAVGGSPPPAGPAAEVCRYRPPLPGREQRIRAAIRSRQQLTLPHARALVERLDRDPAARRRGFAELDFPMRPQDVAYLRDRTRVEDEADRVGRVVERVRGLSGGLSTEDDFPRGAYVLVRVTRPLRARERAAVAAVARRVRTRRVRFSERRLRAAADSLDADALARAGVQLQGWGVDTDRNAVEVEYSSDRPDAEDLIRAGRREPFVFARVPALSPTCTAPDAVAVAADRRTLTLRYTTSGSIDPALARVQVAERADRVEVVVVEQSPPFVTSDAVPRSVTVTLAAPLGDRRVVSLLTRRPLPVRR